MDVFAACVYVHQACAYLVPTEFQVVVTHHVHAVELNSGPRKEQKVLLTTELSLQLHFLSRMSLSSRMISSFHFLHPVYSLLCCVSLRKYAGSTLICVCLGPTNGFAQFFLDMQLSQDHWPIY